MELSTEAQRSFFEFKALLENAHERGKQLLELTGDKVAQHVSSVAAPDAAGSGYFSSLTERHTVLQGEYQSHVRASPRRGSLL